MYYQIIDLNFLFLVLFNKMIHIIKIFKVFLTFTFWKLAGNVVGCELELELNLY